MRRERYAFVVGWLLVASGAAVAQGCCSSLAHRRGQVIEVTGSSVTVRLRSGDSAVAGQELAVKRLSRNTVVSPKAGGGGFRRTTVGRVRIDEVLDEQLVRGTVLEGEIRQGDLVVLEAPPGAGEGS